MLCFFPWVGAVIGFCLYWWNELCTIWKIDVICQTAVGMAVPVFITGGFHVDGFMDTMDAFHSYQSRERKLEILKDSHIGAFAVIMLAAYGLVYGGALSEISDSRLLKIVCSGFFLSRCFSGISAVSFPLAKNDGMLHVFASSSRKRAVRIVLWLQALACMGLMIFWSWPAGLCGSGAAAAALGYYYWRCKKEFGGITGDTAGYFVLLCQLGIIAAVAVIHIGEG